MKVLSSNTVAVLLLVLVDVGTVERVPASIVVALALVVLVALVVVVVVELVVVVVVLVSLVVSGLSTTFATFSF